MLCSAGDEPGGRTGAPVGGTPGPGSRVPPARRERGAGLGNDWRAQIRGAESAHMRQGESRRG
jgi:hypothetical protein